MKKHLSLLAILCISQLSMASLSGISGNYCPNTPIGLSLTPGALSESLLDLCLNTETEHAPTCEELAEDLDVEQSSFHSVNIFNFNGESDAIPAVLSAQWSRINSISVGSRTISNTELEGLEGNIACAYDPSTNNLVYESIEVDDRQSSQDTTYRNLMYTKNSNATSSQFTDVVITVSGNAFTFQQTGPVSITYDVDATKSFHLYSTSDMDSLNNIVDTTVTSSAQRVEFSITVPIRLDVIESGQITNHYTFEIDSEYSCGGEGQSTCTEEMLSCLGPFDLKNQNVAIGDITVCADGTTVRKNVLNADGSISKEIISTRN